MSTQPFELPDFYVPPLEAALDAADEVVARGAHVAHAEAYKKDGRTVEGEDESRGAEEGR